MRKAKEKACCTPWTTTLLGSWHAKFRATFACPLFLQTHRACRMQGDEGLHLHRKESERRETFLHEHTTDSAVCSRFAFTAGGGAAAGQLCNRPRLLCAHARFVGCKVALFSYTKTPVGAAWSSISRSPSKWKRKSFASSILS